MPIRLNLSSMFLFPGFLFPAICAVALAQVQQIPVAASNGQITLDVAVTPKAGKPVVANLTKEQFTVLDNKVPQPVTSFAALTLKQEPIEVILLLDALNTSYNNIAYERQEITKFLDAEGGHLAHPTAIAVLTDKGVRMQQSFFTDGHALSRDLDNHQIGLSSIPPSSGVYGADERMQLSLGALSQITAREVSRPGRKIILWVSPGWPILSGPGIQLSDKQRQQIFSTIVGASTRLREGRITLYAINSLGVREDVGRAAYYQKFLKGVTKPSQTDIGDVSLQVLAAQSGGLVLNSTDTAALLQQAVADTDAYYELSFKAANASQPNEYHHIEVRVDAPGLTARTRDGYYAQP